MYRGYRRDQGRRIVPSRVLEVHAPVWESRAMGRHRSRSKDRPIKGSGVTAATETAGIVASRRRSTQAGLGAVLLATAVAPLIAVSLAGGGGRPPDRVVDPEVAALLTGIPQQGNALGQPKAPVTLRVYTDLECLTARGWVVELLPAIIKRYVRSGEMRIEFRSFKTDTHNPSTFLNQQAAAIAAGAQNRLWNFVETFYYEQGKEYTPYATERYIDGIAAQVPGLRTAQWHRYRASGRLEAQVVADDREVRELGFYDTPAFMIGRTGGQMKRLTGRYIVWQFPGFNRMRDSVSLIDTQDLQKAIGTLPA
jgi:protein-disulfide isomerase